MPSILRFLLLAFLTICCTCVRAQKTAYSVHGTLELPDGYRPGGNVLLLNPPDSSFIRGEFFLDGTFMMSGLETPEALLQFTSLEFADQYFLLRYSGEEKIDLGIIKVAPAGLDMAEIVVVGRQPVYLQRADGTVEVAVANTTLAASSSTAEIMARLPDVTIDEDGAMSILGKGEAIVYLDGQLITADQVALISPANIKNIAVIRNPPARYDASGGAVIEITSLRQRDDGYRIRLQQNLGDSDFGGWQSFTAINTSVNSGRFSATGNYSLQTGNDRHVKFTTRNRTDPAVFLSSAVNIDWKRKLTAYQQYGLGLQYSNSDGSALSLAYSGFSEQLGGNSFNTNRLIDDGGTLNYATTIDRNERDRNNSLSLNYSRSLDSLGSRLFIGAQANHFQNTTNNPITELGETPSGPTERRLQQLLDLDVDVLSLQLDYTRAMRNGNSFEAGLRIGQVTNFADLRFSIAEAGESFQPSQELSSLYDYEELVAAAYLSYAGRWSDRLTYSAGLRAEQTAYTLAFEETGVRAQTDSYLNLFPSGSLTWQFQEGRSLNFSYVSRIRRPPFQSLNPNLIYQDPYTSIQGNANLIPEKVHAIELVGKLGNTTLKAGYSFTFDPLGGGAIRGDSPRSYVLKRLNLSEQFEWYAAASHMIDKGWWTSSNTASLSYTKISSFEIEFAPVKPRPQPYLFSDNRFRCGNLFNLELLLWYAGELREGTFIRYDYANATVALDKSFFGGALKGRLIVNDVFNTVRASGDYAIGETDIYFDNKWRSSYLRLAFTYDFGQLKQARFKNRATGAAEGGRVR